MPGATGRARRLLRLVRAAARRPAAALGLRRQVRAAQRRLQPRRAGEDATALGSTAWVFIALIILSGLAALIAMMRTGIRTFWAPLEGIVAAGARRRDRADHRCSLALCSRADDCRPARSCATRRRRRARCMQPAAISEAFCARIRAAPDAAAEGSHEPHPALSAADRRPPASMWLLLNSVVARPYPARSGDRCGCLAGHGGAPAREAPAAPLAAHPRLVGRRCWSTSCDPTSRSPRVILQRRRRERAAGFVSIPLELRDRNGLGRARLHRHRHARDALGRVRLGYAAC